MEAIKLPEYEAEIEVCDREFEEALRNAEKQIIIDSVGIRKAYEFAKRMHGNTRRYSGLLYLRHPVKAFSSLAKLKCRDAILKAALLHDILEDCDCTYELLRQEFGSEVADIVLAVTEIKSELKPKEETVKDMSQGERKRELDRLTDAKLISTEYQREAFLVRFADRLHNLQTVDACTSDKRREKILSTEEFLIPAARKLGVYYFEIMLQDVCMKFKGDYKNNEYVRIERERNALIETIKDEGIRVVKDREGREKRKCYQQLFLGRFQKMIFEQDKLAIARYNPFLRKNYPSRILSIYEIKKQLGTKPFSRQNMCLREIVLTTASDQSAEIIHEFIAFCRDKLSAEEVRFEYCGKMNDAQMFILTDRYENNYRVLILPESKLETFYIGTKTAESISMIDDASAVDAIRPTHGIIYTYAKNKRREFKNLLPKDATVLDLAFYVNPYLAVTVKAAMIHASSEDYDFREDEHRYPLSTTLNEGEMVQFDADYFQGEERKNNKSHASLEWFMYLKTDYAKRCLIEYLKTQFPHEE